jgi:hypothetical protein
MTIQIEIKPHKAGGSVHVSVFDTHPEWGSKTMLRMDTNGHTWGWVPVSSPGGGDVSFTLPDNTIHPLIQTLLGWVMKRDGAKLEPFNLSGPAADRHDEYAAERERVDKLLDVVAALVENQ